MANSLAFDILAREKVGKGITSARMKISDGMKSIEEKTGASGGMIGMGLGAGLATGLGTGFAQYLDVSSSATKLENQLGVGPAKAAAMSKVSANLFTKSWGDSMDTVNNAVSTVYRNIGNTSAAQGGLEGVTKKAIALSQTFDQDVGGVTSAVGTMMKTGLVKNANEAFDVLTRGFQTGANKADDLLDTMTEYPPQFTMVGLNAAEAMGLMSQGLDAGARDTDFLADAIKELVNTSAGEMSKLSSDGKVELTALGKAYKAVGLDGSKAQKDIAKGGPAAKAAFSKILDGLREIKDPLKRNNAAFQIFGTKSEDLRDTLYALDMSSASKELGNVGNAADTMAKKIEQSPAMALESFKRKALMTLTDLSGGLVMFGTGHKTALLGFVAVVGGLAAAIFTVNAAVRVVNASIAAWNTVTAVATVLQKGWNLAMKSNPIGLIITALFLLGTVLVILWQRNETFRNIVTAAWNGIRVAVGSVIGWIGSFFTSTWNKLGRSMTSLRDAGSSAWRFLRSVASSSINGIMSKVNGLKNSSKSLWNFISGPLSSVWDKVRSNAISAFNKIISFIDSATRRISDAWNSTVGRIHLPGGVASMLSIPGLANGGTIVNPGVTLVGERGPELLMLPTGASVTPLTGASRSASGGQGIGGSVTLVIKGDDSDTGRFIAGLLRKTVRTEYRGNVQMALGR